MEESKQRRKEVRMQARKKGWKRRERMEESKQKG